MTNYLQRARSALHEFLRGRGPSLNDTAPPDVERSSPDIVTFDAVDPLSWIDALDVATARDVPLSDSVVAVAEELARRFSPDALLPSGEGRRVFGLLRPRPGLTARLRLLHRGRLLDALFGIGEEAGARALLSIESLERLLVESSLTAERFGSMLREVSAPELIVVALLLQDVRDAQGALDRLEIEGEARRSVEFLLRNHLQMSLIAFRQDTGDPNVIGHFAALFSTEEDLKMLSLVTVADLAAKGRETLSPWKAELLWRLFVDSYNHMTMFYGDEVIDHSEAALASLRANRPHDVTEAEMAAFLEGLPRRYLTLFAPESIYQHVRLRRDIGANDVHFFLNKKSNVWELTVVTLDKPYLFSNICGVLSYLDLDILRGHALTSRGALVVDVFQFTDHKGCVVRPQLDPLLSDIVAGRADVTALLKEREGRAPARPGGTSPVIYFDHESSPRYTILELLADDAPGLLHRVSRVLSAHGCEVDLVIISTEAGKAFDVFHMRKEGAKLSESDELALTEELERMLESVAV
jgi:[protein-PII] uridylyltransferase